MYDVEVIVARMSRKMKLALLRYNFGDAWLLLVLCVIIMMIVKRTVSRTALVYTLCPDEY